MKTFSVILTTYNGEDSIKDTIESILNQKGISSRFDIELFVIDDESTDRTREILEELDVKYYSTGKNSGGPNKGRNIGLSLSTGDYICIADQDDVWMEERLLSYLPILKDFPIVTSGFKVLHKNLEKEEFRYKDCNRAFIDYERNETFLSKLTRNIHGQNTYLGAIIYHSSFKNILFEEEFGMIDYDWVLRLFKDNKSAELCEMTYVRNVEERNLSLNEEYRLNDYKFSYDFVDLYLKEYPREVEISKDRLNGSLARYYYVTGNMGKSRQYFRKTVISAKTILYYITTFCGSSIVKRYFNVFG